MDTDIGKALFHHDQTYDLLVCKLCHIAVNPKTLAAHLRISHEAIDADVRRQLAESLIDLPVATSHEELALPSCPLAISYITVTKDYKCSKCGKCLGAVKSMAKHIRDHRRGFSGGPSISSIDVLIHPIFAQPPVLVEVQAPVEGLPPDPEPLDQFLQRLRLR